MFRTLGRIGLVFGIAILAASCGENPNVTQAWPATDGDVVGTGTPTPATSPNTTGSTGATGTNGSNGTNSGGNGTNGSNGTNSGGNGTNGSNGTNSGGNGTNGSNGTNSGGNGTNGSNGTNSGGNGTNGSNGTNSGGSTGSSGSSGVTGSSGSGGNSGSSGNSGSTGSSGSSGNSGSTGSSGSSGNSGSTGSSGSSGNSGSTGSSGSSGNSGSTGSSGPSGSSGSTGSTGSSGSGCDHGCHLEHVVLRFKARDLSRDEKSALTLPYNEPVLNLGGSDGHQGRTSFVQDGQVLFAFDLSGLPSRDSVKKVRKARIQMSVIHDGPVNGDVLCLLGNGICSGQSDASEANSGFWNHADLANGYFADQISSLISGSSSLDVDDGDDDSQRNELPPSFSKLDELSARIASASVSGLVHADCGCQNHTELYSGELDLKVKRLLAGSDTRVLDWIYGGSGDCRDGHSVTLAVGENNGLSDCGATLELELDVQVCPHQSEPPQPKPTPTPTPTETPVPCPSMSPSPAPSPAPSPDACLAPYASSPYASYQLLAKMCTVMMSCHPELSCDECVAGVTRNTLLPEYSAGPSYNGCGLDAQFGFDEPSQPYGWMMAQEAAGVIHATSTQSIVSCFDAIDSLSCGDSAVQNSYVAGQSDPFAGVCSMIPNNIYQCIGVFSGWEQQCMSSQNFVYPAPWHTN